MSRDKAALASPRDDRRRQRLLDAAVGTFLRFGFRKTSMEEVARAADVSRQALYLHYATKEALFGAAVRHVLETGLDAASAKLGDPALSLEEKLTGAFDAWVGRFVGIIGSDVSDLEEASDVVVGPLLFEYEERFVEAVAKAIRASGLPRAYKARSIGAKELAETLSATARGLKHKARSRAEFGERFDVAVRALCMPIAERH